MDFTSIIKGIAPMLATTLASPAGPLAPLAGMAVSAIIGAISPQAASQVSQAQTDGGIQGALAKVQDLFTQGSIQAADLKKAEIAHTERMAELGYKNVADLEAIAAGDRANARSLQAATKSAMPAILSAIALISEAIIAIVVLTGYAKSVFADPATAAIAGAIVMQILSEAKQMYSYWFGTTSDSGRKTELLAQSPAVK